MSETGFSHKPVLLAECIEALKDRKIKFIYITSDADFPFEAYRQFLEDFRGQGEHLRLTKDQWNLLTSKFDIYGIPHCVIVNKQGEVVNNFFAGSWRRCSLIFYFYISNTLKILL